jgi:CBS domain-containing protein
MAIAKDLMTPLPISIDAHALVSKAVEILASLDIRHLPVVDASGAIVGMISDRDVSGEVTKTMAVTSVMSAPPICAPESADVAALAKLMVDHKIGAVAIVSADGRLVGIVSYVDLLRTLTRAVRSGPP